MKPIQRSTCPDPLSSPAAQLAALIDEQARNTPLPASHEQGRDAAPDNADASGPATLIWVEGLRRRTTAVVTEGRASVIAGE